MSKCIFTYLFSFIRQHVPLIVELCVQIVESRGLDVVGIYRVPGNNASVSVLTDMVNQGIDDIVLQDSRWNDVNIVSSLLKAFFRKLPEPLLTSFLYPKFIQASKIDDPMKRLKAIKHVVRPSLLYSVFLLLYFIMIFITKFFMSMKNVFSYVHSLFQN